jgi:hypothetical protein
LRDISHLYISQRPGARSAPPWPAAPSRRVLRVAITGPRSAALARVEVCANLAVQFARLGKRTLVFDLDPDLPSLGLRLGLDPEIALAHLTGAAPPRVARALLGVRLVLGGTRVEAAESLAGAAREALQAVDCVLLHLPPLEAALPALAAVAPLLALPATDTTVERAAARSPMFGAWLATAQRPQPLQRVAAVVEQPSVDGALWVRAAGENGGENEASGLAGYLAPAPVHELAWGDGGAAAAPPAWARLPAHPVPPRWPIAVLEPEHAASRLYEGLAQSLLAGLARRGGSHA